MEYRLNLNNGNKISLLGFGAMRLKTKNGNIDLDLATQQLKYAIDNGINYIDTAYLYGNGFGSNERALGQILENLNYRDKVYLSTKMNRMAIHSYEDMDKMFNNQLNNLRTSYIDYYFLHNVISYEDVLNLIDIGLFDFINEKKENGEIHNIGFSYHGSYNDFKKILKLYDWDVTLLQYNYLDDKMQAGLEGIKLANQNNMAVIIMEPLKGGLLAGTMPQEVENLINNSNTTRSNVDLALSWIFDTPEVTCVLSGMNSIEMLKDNIQITNNHIENPLNSEENKLLDDIKEVMLRLNKINCTFCNYCMPCPKGIYIPDIFKLYNDKHMFPENKLFGINQNWISYASNILGITGKAHDPSLCVGCGICHSKCPQQLKIPELLRKVDKSYHGQILRLFMPIIKKFMNIVM